MGTLIILGIFYHGESSSTSIGTYFLSRFAVHDWSGSVNIYCHQHLLALLIAIGWTVLLIFYWKRWDNGLIPGMFDPVLQTSSCRSSWYFRKAVWPLENTVTRSVISPIIMSLRTCNRDESDSFYYYIWPASHAKIEGGGWCVIVLTSSQSWFFKGVKPLPHNGTREVWLESRDQQLENCHIQ